MGDLTFDKRGLARRGLLVRHLVMPEALAETRYIMREEPDSHHVATGLKSLWIQSYLHETLQQKVCIHVNLGTRCRVLFPGVQGVATIGLRSCMDDYALHHYTDTECEATFAELFPQGFAGQDVLDEL